MYNYAHLTHGSQVQYNRGPAYYPQNCPYRPNNMRPRDDLGPQPMELDQAEHQKGNPQIKPAQTEADKKAYKKNGQCFHCGNKGYLSKLCPHKLTFSNTTGSKQGHVTVLEEL